MRRRVSSRMRAADVCHTLRELVYNVGDLTPGSRPGLYAVARYASWERHSLTWRGDQYCSGSVGVLVSSEDNFR